MSLNDAAAKTALALEQPADATFRPDRLLGILSPYQLNFVAAGTMLGKWRLILPQLNQYLADGRFFSHGDGRHAPPRMGLVTQGSPTRFTSMCAAMKLDRLTPQNLPIVQTKIGESFEDIQSSYDKFFNHPQLLIVDSLHSFMHSGEISKFGDVRDFTHRLQEWAERKQVTILATVLKAKTKAGQGYERTLDGVLGSVRWIAGAGTFITIDYPSDQPETTSKRRVMIAGHDSAWIESEWEFDPIGRLVPAQPTFKWHERMMRYLDQKPLGVPFRTAEMNSWAVVEEVPLSTMKLWIREMESKGEIRRIRKGMYTRPQVC